MVPLPKRYISLVAFPRAVAMEPWCSLIVVGESNSLGWCRSCDDSKKKLRKILIYSALTSLPCP